MASPVDTSVKWFTSKMLGAPVLRGQVGSLIAILDACLVNGWGVQVANTCVVSGGVCTMTFPLDHAAPVDGVVLVAGASIASLNGDQKVTATAPNVVKFATAAANGTATGTITAKMAPGGWNKPFSGTNLAVYKSADAAANGHFVRVNDTGATFARANAYETMTAVSTGTGLTPTAIQLNGGLYWHKSAVANSAPIDWYCVTDGRMFYFGCASYQGNDTLGNAGVYATYVSGPIFGFGDPKTFAPGGDPFSTLIFGSHSADNGSAGLYFLSGRGAQSQYTMRGISGTGTAMVLDCQNTVQGFAGDPMFDAVSGQVSMSKVIGKNTGTLSKRVEIAGVTTSMAVSMERVFTYLSSFKSGTPERTYLAVPQNENTGNVSGLNLLAFDITGPWR